MATNQQDNSANWQLRDHFQRRYNAMEVERNSFLPHWQEIADYLSPRTARIYTTINTAKGSKANDKIIDPTATLSLRTLKSGLMAGLTSPARPWFRLSTSDPDMMGNAAVKDWLYQVETRMREMFNRSNLYQVLPTMYGNLGAYGTAAISVLEDDRRAIRFHSFYTGSYMLSVDNNGRCDSMYRKYPMTVRQLVQQFGMDAVSPSVKNLWDSSQYEIEIEIVHAIEPNDDRDDSSNAAFDKPWRSVYYEANASYGLFLRKSGFDEFPIIAPRWDIFDESVYGFSPAMDCLGDIKQLQLEQRRKMEAIDKYIRPPMVADSALKTQGISLIPNGITYIDGLAQQKHSGLRPAYQVNPSIKEIMEDINECQYRIKRTFFEDMMQMMSQSDNPEMTAREIEERHSEKVLILGPVMERLNDECFDPLIDRTFSIMFRRGMIPTRPDTLQGQSLKIEYTSIMAQAQKLMGTANINAIAGFVGQIASIDPQALDKFNVDEAIDVQADMFGVSPKIIRTKDQVGILREQRAQQQRMAQMAAMAQPMKDGAQAAKALGDTDSENAKAILQTMTGQR
jgi:hypothetical protein